jgi:hypothetical protein
MMLFHSNQLSLTGTEIALYDYAFYTREFFNYEPIIVSNRNNNLNSLEKFKGEFDVYLYDDFKEVQSLVDKRGIEYSYFIKSGEYDGKVLENTKNLIHSVFQVNEPHGDVYAYVSEWLSYKVSGGKCPFVPHIIDINKYNTQETLRSVLGIKETDLVFGYYGGVDAFNINFVREFIFKISETCNDIYFIFMNIPPFINSDKVIFLKGSVEISDKVKFINTCDACLHARIEGETFGLTIAEFSSLNKPVITYNDVYGNGGKAHLHILKDKGFFYKNEKDLEVVIKNFRDFKNKYSDWDCYKDYNPKNVMDKFKNVFIR